jgi:hypothetical protein
LGKIGKTPFAIMGIIKNFNTFPHINKGDTKFVATLALGSWPRQGLARLWAKRKPRSEGKCEGMNLHTPKGATLGIWNPGGLPNLQRVIAGVKANGLKSFLYHWKAIET